MSDQAPSLESPYAALAGVVNIDEARRLWGEPEYGYFKEWMQATRRSRRIEHYGSGKVEITKAEFDAEYAISRRREIDRFMGDFKGSFWNLTIEVKKWGWPQELEKQMENINYAVKTPKA